MQQRRWKQGVNEMSRFERDDSLSAQLYRCYAPKMLAYLSLHIPHIPVLDDAEDMLLEVFLIAFEHQSDLENLLEDEQRAWLWTVARNKMIDYHRRTRHQSIVPLEHIVEMMDNDERGPEHVALRHEEHDRLRSYLKQLSPLQQEVLQLRFTGGLRCAEIARVLQKREGAIRTMLSRSMDMLRGIYEHQVEGGHL